MPDTMKENIKKEPEPEITRFDCYEENDPEKRTLLSIKFLRQCLARLDSGNPESIVEAIYALHISLMVHTEFLGPYMQKVGQHIEEQPERNNYIIKLLKEGIQKMDDQDDQGNWWKKGG
jgi:hypothetical protein